ncbi:MAG: hypothetical protein PHI06_07980 [Desulfobulbaceae bacterium]|nr:hypothetical protein [Desulfobulbaceae bacterium]
MLLRSFFFSLLICLYGVVFFAQEHQARSQSPILQIALPANFQKITTGYLFQLAAEMLFIKTSVFLGGLQPGFPPTTYAKALGNNFEVMTTLYPRFIDPYFFCQAFLPNISREEASKANSILETGINAFPDDFIFRFFYGTNYFLAMDEPLKAAKAFGEAAKMPNAPLIFGRLEALLSAKGGDILAGLIALKTMLAAEKDEIVRARYQHEIEIFEQAKLVREALTAYEVKHNSSPGTLAELVPEFLQAIPDIKDSFSLVYDPPALRLERIDKRAGSR